MNYKLLLSVFFLSTHVYSLDIYSEVSSTILSMKNIGDKVAKGEVIVQLDSRQAELELKAQEMILETKEYVFNDRQKILVQTQELYDRLVGSKRNLDLAQENFDAARREFEAQKIAVEIAKIELEKYQIKSPVNGTVDSIPSPRNLTNISNPKILMVIDPD